MSVQPGRGGSVQPGGWVSQPGGSVSWGGGLVSQVGGGGGVSQDRTTE